MTSPTRSGRKGKKVTVTYGWGHGGGFIVYCDDHPNYKGLSRPRRKCDVCRWMFDVRSRSDKFWKPTP